MTRIALVDERDSTFDRHDTRFRLFVYEGPANAVSVYELADCSAEEALETAEMLSRSNELIWSLAVLLDAPVRGMTWISGMDYNAQPQRARVAWRLRRQMQDRYLSAKSSRGEPLLLPNGLRRIRVFPEWGGELPLWESFSDHYPHEPGDLPIPRELEQELIEWNREWQGYGEEAERPDSWREWGWGLHERLQTALAGYAEVSPEFDDRDGPA